MMNNECILFAGNASESLAKLITSDPTHPIQLGEIEHHKFPSGEWGCQLKRNVRGADVFLLQSTSEPANDNLMQLLIMADAARRASAGRITAVMPYMGYSRQDRKEESRVPISAKLVMNILEAAGIHRVVAMDLHAAQIGGFTDLPFDHLHFRPSLTEAVKDKHIDVIVSPDTGGIKRAMEYAEAMDLDFAFIAKKRKNDTTVKAVRFVGDVKDKNVLIVDDLTETAGTLIEGAKECKANGAKTIHCAVTHGCMDGMGLDRLYMAHNDTLIDMFFCSNTVYDTFEPANSWVQVVDVAPVFRKAIFNIHTNKSVSSLFQ